MRQEKKRRERESEMEIHGSNFSTFVQSFVRLRSGRMNFSDHYRGGGFSLSVHAICIDRCAILLL
jgi:hypothetical protein